MPKADNGRSGSCVLNPTESAVSEAGENHALCPGLDRTHTPHARFNSMAVPEHDARNSVYAMAGIYTIGGFAMSDDKNQIGGQDRQRISLSDDYEVRDWSQKYGVSEERLRAAVGKVGNMADDVERELRGR